MNAVASGAGKGLKGEIGRRVLVAIRAKMASWMACCVARGPADGGLIEARAALEESTFFDCAESEAELEALRGGRPLVQELRHALGGDVRTRPLGCVALAQVTPESD